LCGGGVLAVLAATFIPYAPAIANARDAGFSSAEIETGLQFTFERRWFTLASTALELGLLSLFALTSVGRRVADRFLSWTYGWRIPAAVALGGTIWAVHQLLYLPIGIASFYHRHYWGMSNLDLDVWLREYALSQGIEGFLELVALVGLYMLLVRFPRTWWLIAPFGASALAMGYALLSPIVINPLFNTFTPLAETQWAEQQPRVEALIKKAGVPVQEILVMDASRQSNHTNAYFTGFGPTRRIVLYDTLLKNHSADEIESVLGHEIGHWRHDHIVKGILLGTLAALVGFFVLHRALRHALGRAPWNLMSMADPAGLPLVMLLMFLGSWVAMPLGNLVSRHFERQADQASLELADVPTAFIATEQKMARDNKMNVAPTPWNVWLFASHPPVVERIQMAKDWERKSD
jgi:STE24 endopeptidase